MNRRKFLSALGFGAVAAPMVDPLFESLKKRGISVTPEDLLKPTELQKPLSDGDLMKIYRATLKDMGLHNEAIDRMAGKWKGLADQKRRIKESKEAHQKRTDEIVAGIPARRKGRLNILRKRELHRRLREALRTKKPKLP